MTVRGGLQIVLLGLVYPLALTGVAGLVFPFQAHGSLLTAPDGTLVGSALIGQSVSKPQHVHPRPSAAGSDGYDAGAPSGSHLGPTNQKLIDAVEERADAYRQENELAADAAVPVDAVTASASGLDAEISPANAARPVGRLAAARGLPAGRVQALVAAHTSGRTLGILGEPRVNVLQLNLALDALR